MFLAPHSADQPTMPQRIVDRYAEQGVTMVNRPDMIARAIVDGLAAAYGQAMQQLRQLTQLPLGHLTVVGGGSKHSLLNQLTAEATLNHLWSPRGYRMGQCARGAASSPRVGARP